MIIGIVAIAKNHAIGKNRKLPWHYSADLKFFKETTSGNAVVMGAKTWVSIGRPLPNRLNIVLSRSGDVETPPEVMRLSTKEEVVELAKYLNRNVFIIGGAGVYDSFGDVIDKWIITDVPIEVADADTFFPPELLSDFEETSAHELGDDLTVRILQRK